MERVEAALREPADGTARSARSSASIGVALSGEGPDTPAALLQDADRAMYRAKNPER